MTTKKRRIKNFSLSYRETFVAFLMIALLVSAMVPIAVNIMSNSKNVVKQSNARLIWMNVQAVYFKLNSEFIDLTKDKVKLEDGTVSTYVDKKTHKANRPFYILLEKYIDYNELKIEDVEVTFTFDNNIFVPQNVVVKYKDGTTLSYPDPD